MAYGVSGFNSGNAMRVFILLMIIIMNCIIYLTWTHCKQIRMLRPSQSNSKLDDTVYKGRYIGNPVFGYEGDKRGQTNSSVMGKYMYKVRNKPVRRTSKPVVYQSIKPMAGKYVYTIRDIPAPRTTKPVVYQSMKPTRCVVHGMRQQCIGPFRQNLIGINQCPDPICSCFPFEVTLLSSAPMSQNSLYWYSKGHMLPDERETLHDPEFIDIRNTASAEYSKIKLLNSTNHFKVGDLVSIQINLIDGYGLPRLIGGDEIRVWMKSPSGAYRAAGTVVDHKNGSYTGVLKALWEGEATIYTALPYTREAIASMYKWRRQYRTLFYYYGLFRKGNSSEHVYCSPYSTIPGYTSVCDLSLINFNYPWFCGRPLNPKLTCDDFIMASDFDYTQFPVTPAQFITFDRENTFTVIATQLHITVTEGQGPQIKINCNKLEHRETWDINIPTGYVQNNSWESLKCYNPVHNASIVSCLKDTNIMFHGDSTTRQYYTALKDLLQCKQTTVAWSNPKWYEVSSCVHEQRNTTLSWLPPAFPFVTGYKQPDGKTTNLKSAVSILNNMPSSGKVIFVIHFYCHFVRQHYTLYTNHIRSLKSAIKSALNKNKDLHIAIKSPHVFYNTQCPSHLNDYFGKLFIDILQRELAEFKDYVLFLNYWDMNIAWEVEEIHPPNNIVMENLRLLFGYICGRNELL